METEACAVCRKVLLSPDGLMPQAKKLHDVDHAEHGQGIGEYSKHDSPAAARGAGFEGSVLLLRDGQLIPQIV